jgi:hypothetical protein
MGNTILSVWDPFVIRISRWRDRYSNPVPPACNINVNCLQLKDVWNYREYVEYQDIF